MIRPIISDLKELHQKSELVRPDEDISEILRDLEDTLLSLNGYGLAAPQIGVKKCIAIARFEDKKITLINPSIISKDNKFIFRGEGCLSIGGGSIRINTDRYEKIIYQNGIEGQTLAGQGIEAVIVQHEVDHLNGLTIRERRHVDLNKRKMRR